MLTQPDSLFHSLILSPFTNKPVYISMSLLYHNKNSGQARADVAQEMMGLLTTGFMAQCVWTLTWWEAVALDELHTHLQRTWKFSIGSGCGSRPRGRAEDPDSISNMPSIRSSWVGEHTLRLDNEPVTSNTWKTQLCIWKKVLWSCCRVFFLVIDSSVNLFAHSVSFHNFRMNCLKYYIKLNDNWPYMSARKR